MALAPALSNAAAIVMCNGLVDLCDVGSTNTEAHLRIYDGSKPANPDVAVSGQTLLAELLMTDPAFGAAGEFGGSFFQPRPTG